MKKLQPVLSALLGCTLLLAGCQSPNGGATATPEESTGTETSAQPEMSDAEIFASEYTQVPEDNLYVIRTPEEIIKILKNGSGIVLLGFPECPWCQRYAVYLNEVAKEAGLTKIYYCNIGEERNNNTDAYQEMIALIGEDNLLYDEEGNSRIYVPDITFLVKGEIIGHDNTTSVVTEEDGTPDEYWTPERVTEIKEKLMVWAQELVDSGCEECNVTNSTSN